MCKYLDLQKRKRNRPFARTERTITVCLFVKGRPSRKLRQAGDPIHTGPSDKTSSDERHHTSERILLQNGDVDVG